jgi:uncharacterized protein (DUF2147 family)
MIKSLFVLSALFFASLGTAQTAVGVWQTTDDETGKAKGHIQLFEQNGELHGRVIKLLNGVPDKGCPKCEDHRRGKPVVGMVIIEDLQLKDGYWQSGKVLDTNRGKWFNVKMWLEDGNPNVLAVRGSFGPIYRTQYWKRVL